MLHFFRETRTTGSKLLGVVMQIALFIEGSDMVLLQMVSWTWLWLFIAGGVSFLEISSDWSFVLSSFGSLVGCSEDGSSCDGWVLDWPVDLVVDGIGSWSNFQGWCVSYEVLSSHGLVCSHCWSSLNPCFAKYGFRVVGAWPDSATVIGESSNLGH